MSHEEPDLCLPAVGLGQAALLSALHKGSKQQHASEKWVDSWDTSEQTVMPSRASTLPAKMP